MIARHLTRRAPKKTGGFSFGRFPSECGTYVTFRLFRRDHRGALHMEARTFFTSADPTYIAKVLRHAKRQLRDRVDEIDLAAMEQAA